MNTGRLKVDVKGNGIVVNAVLECWSAVVSLIALYCREKRFEVRNCID